nr:uncharacterized protein LOC104117356 [Nicotiana tomentosiformis]
MPLVFFLYPIPYVKILYWVFNKLEDAFEDRPAVLGKKGRSSSVLAGNSIESSSMAEPVIIIYSAAIIAFFLGWLQLKFQDSHQNLFQEHSTIVSIAVGSLVMLWCIFVIYVKCARLCQVYARNLPFEVDFFAFLSIASTCSLLLPHSLVFVLYLSPSVKILYWVFDKLEDAFEDKQFWAKKFDPVLSRPKIPLQTSR